MPFGTKSPSISGSTKMHSPRFIWLALPLLTRAICDCGFSVSGHGDEAQEVVFTDILETDFTTVKDISTDQEWIRQQFRVSPDEGRGEFGKAFMTVNVDTRPEESNEDGALESDRSLSLHVGKDLDRSAVPGAEIDSARLDLHWGSYRAALRTTKVNGTCAAFFWVRLVQSVFSISDLSAEKPDRACYCDEAYETDHADQSISTIHKRSTLNSFHASLNRPKDFIP